MEKLTGAILAVGAPDNTSDIRYITGFTSADPLAYLQIQKQKYLIVGRLDVRRAAAVRGVQVFSVEAAAVEIATKATFQAVVIGLLRRANADSVTVAGDFPSGFMRELEQAGIRVHVRKGSLFPAREVKSPDEIDKLKRCQRVACEAMRMALRMLAQAGVDRRGRLRQDGRLLTAAMLRRAIDVELMKHDCSGAGTIVSCGKESAEPHGVGSGPLLAGECIMLDIFPRNIVTGYWGDITRTVVKGRASRRIERMYAAVRAAQAAALAEIRPGVKAATVHRAAVKTLEQMGFETFKSNGLAEGFVHGTGHGVGVDIHEPPRISEAPGRLRRGHVITVEPGLYYHDVGGVRIEDLVEVTREGWRYLGTCGKTLEV